MTLSTTIVLGTNTLPQQRKCHNKNDTAYCAKSITDHMIFWSRMGRKEERFRDRINLILFYCSKQLEHKVGVPSMKIEHERNVLSMNFLIDTTALCDSDWVILYSISNVLPLVPIIFGWESTTINGPESTAAAADGTEDNTPSSLEKKVMAPFGLEVTNKLSSNSSTKSLVNTVSAVRVGRSAKAIVALLTVARKV